MNFLIYLSIHFCILKYLKRSIPLIIMLILYFLKKDEFNVFKRMSEQKLEKKNRVHYSIFS